jgi:hypothetical protein
MYACTVTGFCPLITWVYFWGLSLPDERAGVILIAAASMNDFDSIII